MLKSHFKIAWRNLIKHRQFSLLNVAGLSTGLAAAIMILLWVNDEMAIDHFNEKENRIYQVLQNWPTPSGIETTDQTPGLLHSALAAELPEVENATAVIPAASSDREGIISFADKRITTHAQFAGKDFFSIFSYKLIEGDKDNVLANKNAIAISESLAKRLFNHTGIIGQTIEWNQKDFSGSYIVTGVFQDPPLNATSQFELVFNYDLFLQKNQKLENWGNNEPLTYLMLKKNTNIQQFNKKISVFIKQKKPEASQLLTTQKYSERYLYNHFENGNAVGGRIEYVRLFAAIAIIILLIAAINFMNLATAKGASRMKETGIKKAMGAARISLIIQHTSEAVLTSLISLLFALLLVFLLLPIFNTVTSKQLTLFSSDIVLPAFLVTIITGLIAGSYPAFYLSGFRPVAALKGELKTSASEQWIRRVLVVFQFSLSTLFIVTVLVIYKQMDLIQTKNLGYSRENTIWFDKGGMVTNNADDYKPGGKYENDQESFLHELKSIPGVVNAANFRHSVIDRNGGTSDISWEGKEPDQHTEFTDIGAGYNFIETMGIRVKEGRTFSKLYGAEKTKIIFNEAAIEAMGLKNPVGKTVHIWGEDRQIIGVVKNFNFQSLHEKLKPCFFDLTTSQRASKIVVRIQAGHEKETIQRIEKFYKNYNQGIPFKFNFLDADYQALYSSEIRIAELSKYFAGLAILISCLGLFGLAAFTTEKKRREIGIRKAIGATTSDIIILLYKDFMKLVTLSILIAIPIGYLVTNSWLNDFAYRANPGMSPFLLTIGSIFLLTIFTISFQSLKAAMSTPVKSLRAE
ncbi:MAG: ABC transporter permease [Chitinophagaceae bacterium]